VFDWPAGGRLDVPAFGGTITSARLMSDAASKLEVKPSASGFTVTLPEKAPDPIASVVVLDTTAVK
jgi:hypothetical protein